MTSFLLLGFLLGLRHAFDADHVAAVASLATRGGSIAQQALQGVLWGLGHTATLLLVGGACVLSGIAIPPEAERGFEALVGLMLVGLGVSVLLGLRGRAVRPRGALLVGAVHGLAGSAALVLAVAGSTRSPATGLLTILLFGAGSILGMVGVAVAIALPLNAASRLRGRMHALLCGGAGAFSVLLGARILWISAA